MAGINDNEAQSVDLTVIDRLKDVGWKVGDSLLYQPSYELTEEQKIEYDREAIKPDIVLKDPLNHDILAVFENKLMQEDEEKAKTKLRMLYGQVLKPRFLYACSKERVLFYDTQWKGLDAGEFKRTNEFMSLEDMKIKQAQQKKKTQDIKIKVDTTIAGGYDPDVGKERYYQVECIETLIEKYKAGETKMLVHMATGLGKTRLTVALAKALLQYGLAKKILFVVDRRLLAKQAMDEGFSLISREHTSARLRTTNFRRQQQAPIHVVVIDTLERIFDQIPSSYYDMIIVDECHRSISVSRKVIFDHFHCSRIGLTATPRIAIAKEGKDVSEEDIAIKDTYKLFGCEANKPTYEFDLKRGMDEKFLAEYNIEEILTYLTQEAEKEGIPIDYVLDPETREKMVLPKEKKLKLEQLERKYLSEERCDRIAEEIRKKVQPGEKVILFGVSQVHCQLLANSLNKVYSDDTMQGVRYAEPIISDNQELNEYLKQRFKKFNQKPYITTSVDIMSTGVNIPCARFIGFAALTKSVGKYIQMIGRGTRLDPKTGKFSFQILDFVGLCRRMKDNRRGTPKPNTKVVTGEGGGSGGNGPKGKYFIIDNPDPVNMIRRVMIHGDDVEIVDNIPIEEARRIFEDEVHKHAAKEVEEIKAKANHDHEYQPTEEELDVIDNWMKEPDIYLDEYQLQKIYDYPEGSNWDFLLHALGIKKIPTPKERIEKGYEVFIGQNAGFNDEQLRVLLKLKDIFASNLSSKQKIEIDTIFADPVYERLIGSKEKVNELFEGKLGNILGSLKENLRLPNIHR